MLSQAQRTTIWELHTQGVSKHEIARVLGISRPSVRKVLRSQTTEDLGATVDDVCDWLAKAPQLTLVPKEERKPKL